MLWLYNKLIRPYASDVEPAAKCWCNSVCIMLRHINTVHSSSTKIRETARHSSKTHTYAYCCFCQNWHAYSEGGLACKQWRKGTRGGREVQKTRGKKGEGGTENDEKGRVMVIVMDSLLTNGFRIQPTFPLTPSFCLWVSYLKPCYILQSNNVRASAYKAIACTQFATHAGTSQRFMHCIRVEIWLTPGCMPLDLGSYLVTIYGWYSKVIHSPKLVY